MSNSLANHNVCINSTGKHSSKQYTLEPKSRFAIFDKLGNRQARNKALTCLTQKRLSKSEIRENFAEMPKLYPDDQKKVDQYLAKESQGGERKPFNPWLLLMVVLVVLGLITLAGYWVALNHGVI